MTLSNISRLSLFHCKIMHGKLSGFVSRAETWRKRQQDKLPRTPQIHSSRRNRRRVPEEVKRLTAPLWVQPGNGVSIGGKQDVIEQQLWNAAQTGARQGRKHRTTRLAIPRDDVHRKWCQLCPRIGFNPKAKHSGPPFAPTL